MSSFTQSTVIIAAQDQAAAQADMGVDFFTTGASATGAEPATSFFSAGPFSNDELNEIANKVAWPKLMYFGKDWQEALAVNNLKMVVSNVAP